MRKSYILYIAIINILSLICINNISALNYESSVGIGFTFNPTLSISISSPDLIISNLTPGNSSDSNSINVSVATNASYGYTLSVNSSSDYLTHSNNTDTFSSIATNADLSSLDNSEDNNIWGYNTSLNNGATWSNYNGLSSSASTTLLNTNTNNTTNDIDTIDFKIGVKASSTQASGTYTNTITFTTVTKPTPMNLAESYFAAGKSRYKGYYTMQDMTTEICTNTEVIGEGSQTQLIDIRDDKIYWATKLADGKCWMTQNLDLDLDSDKTYTHWDTDLGWSTENGNSVDENATWQPIRSTIDFSGKTVDNWQEDRHTPYSANPGDIYYYTSDSDVADMQYNSLQECTNAEHNDCTHYHAGNYYNWSAAIANNNTSGMTNGNAHSSICPSNWKIINTNDNDFGLLLFKQNIIPSQQSSKYATNGFNLLRKSPLFFVRAGEINSQNKITDTDYGLYWSNNIIDSAYSKGINFYISSLNVGRFYGRHCGFSIRCLTR